MILPFLISAPYISIIGYAAAGWLRPTIPSTTLQSLSTATLLICCKNEEQQLPSLFQSIEQQLLLPQQILFVNDHSTDNTENLLNAFCNKHSYCSYINAEKNGKKEAILQALPLIKTDYILFTDADCTFHPAWIQTMMTYCTNHKTDILLGSVKINTNHTLFSKLQALEFASLVAANAGAPLNGTPLYGNGAHMAVKREIYLNHQTNLNTHIA